jgi:hypothetical protein
MEALLQELKEKLPDVIWKTTTCEDRFVVMGYKQGENYLEDYAIVVYADVTSVALGSVKEKSRVNMSLMTVPKDNLVESVRRLAGVMREVC